MKKRLKRQRQNIIKIVKLFLILFFFYLSLFSLKYLDKVNINLGISNEEFIKYIILSSNHNIDYEYNRKTSITKVFNYFSSFNFYEPSTIIDTNYKSLVNTDKLVIKEEPNIEDKKEELPLVYIYNTHNLENYRETNNLYSFIPNITTANYILQSKLKELGINSIVEANKVSDILSANNWSYASSYKVSRMFMESAKEKYPSLKYFVDLHRDSVTGSNSTINIDGISYARILFVIGLENRNYQENKEVAMNLNNRINSMYPNLSRGLYEKKGIGVNGVYNQDFSKFTMLVEIGGVDSTLEEVNNSTQILAKVLYDYIGDNLNED